MAEIGRLTGSEAHLVVTAQVQYFLSGRGEEGLTKDSPVGEVGNGQTE